MTSKLPLIYLKKKELKKSEFASNGALPKVEVEEQSGIPLIPKSPREHKMFKSHSKRLNSLTSERREITSPAEILKISGFNSPGKEKILLQAYKTFDDKEVDKEFEDEEANFETTYKSKISIYGQFDYNKIRKEKLIYKSNSLKKIKKVADKNPYFNSRNAYFR
eukprot:CAMPEP_0205810026 /NCGR_PEP_ID=MMETSP0205-20121125/14225_1 /ASSEMBLY_ACC=CAM_ASM_000278 /TAXON_ID=36767 /ORGANISM="Euplotes focardii, Strain TN1" /LENGTH=163 /DNA_ID=CAMNT_0053087783 /DNA_START=422 /DNA_END=913 /DNA_ORIENTATION=+